MVKILYKSSQCGLHNEENHLNETLNPKETDSIMVDEQYIEEVDTTKERTDKILKTEWKNP